MQIKDLSYKGIKQISCGDNYSAALAIFGQVYVAGSLEGGKLGLGKGQKRGYQLNFRDIPHLPEIDYIACGVQHMLAISRHNPDRDASSNQASKQSGKTYAWGKNQRGQLGIGDKENRYSPAIIGNTKERFKKVVCGYNFSLGLSRENGRVYFWGNYKYYCSHKHTKDIEEPNIISELETVEVRDLACDYKYCAALTDKGEIKTWGKYLLENKGGAAADKEKNQTAGGKGGQDAGDKEGEQKIESISKFPVGSSSGPSFTEIVTGPNHTCAIDAS